MSIIFLKYEITISYKDLKITEPIVGLVNTPDHVYFIKDETTIFPTHKDFGFVYISENELPEGFRNKQIKRIFIKQNIWLAVIGIILSLPLGYTMIDYIFKSALSDAYDFPAIIKLPSYLYATIGSFVVAVLVNVILAKKVKTIDMVSSLKGNE